MKTKLIIGLLVIPKLLFANSLRNNDVNIINNQCEIYNTKYSEISNNSKQFFCNKSNEKKFIKKHKKRYQEDQNHEDDLVIVL